MSLRLRCSLGECETVKVTAPTAGYTAGQITKVNDMVGVIVEDADAGEEVAMIYKAPKIVVDKRAGTSYPLTIGDKVYYRSGGPDVTPDSTGNTLCGRCTEDADGVADDEVEICLMGHVAA